MSSSVQTRAPSTSTTAGREPASPPGSLGGELLILIPVLICLALMAYVLTAVPAGDPRPTVTGHCISSTAC